MKNTENVVDTGGENSARKVGGAVAAGVAHALGDDDGSVGGGDHGRAFKRSQHVPGGFGIRVRLICVRGALLDITGDRTGRETADIMAGRSNVADDRSGAAGVDDSADGDNGEVGSGAEIDLECNL